jgi:predicted dehydrogenase
MSANSKGKIRAGIVGIGNWGRYGHIPVLQLLPDFQIVAVSSRRQEYAAEIAKNFGVPHAFTNAQELIIHPEVDLVIVLPPAPQHGALVRDAIAAGKDVYCEWPLTTNREDTEDLLARAEGAGVRHIVGLQRRLGPSARYVRDLLAAGYVGKMRSVRLHVSMNYFQGQRSTDLRWTIPAENFSHILSIYGGHFMDLLFQVVGAPQTVSAVVQNQFPNITLIETGETFPNTTPDQVLVIGTLANGAVFTIQIEGGKRNNSGLQIDITGMEGDLKVSNSLSFGNAEDNKIEGVKGDGEPLRLLPIPERYHDLPASALDASVLDLAYLYAAYANDRENGTSVAPTFADAVKMHRLLDLISAASSTGTRQTVNFWRSSG